MIRFTKGILVLLIAGGSLWWMFHETDQPGRLLRAMPMNSTVYIRADNLAGIWTELLTHPAVLTGAVMSGGEDYALRQLVHDADVRRWVDRLLRRNAVAAYSPAFGELSEPAWVMAAWGGSESVRLRLLLSVFGSPGIQRLPGHHGRNVWGVGEVRPNQPRLTFSVAEGVVVAVFSRDVSAIYRALDGLDLLEPSLAGDRNGFREEMERWGKDSPVCGYVWLPNRNTPGPLGARLVRDARGGLGVDLRVATHPLGTVPEKVPPLPKGMDLLVGDLPVAIVNAMPEVAVELLNLAWPGLFADVFSRLVRANRSGPATLALVGGEASGSLSGKRIPLLLFSAPTPDRQHGLVSVTQTLEDLHNRLGVTFTLEPDVAFPETLFSLNEEGTHAFERFAGEDRLAIALLGDRLICASNLRALRFLLQRLNTPPATFEAGKARWARLARNQPGRVSGWMDVSRSARLMDEYLDLQSAILSMMNPPDLPLRLQALERTRHAWDTATLAREVTARVDGSSTQALVIEIRMETP